MGAGFGQACGSVIAGHFPDMAKIAPTAPATHQESAGTGTPAGDDRAPIAALPLGTATSVRESDILLRSRARARAQPRAASRERLRLRATKNCVLDICSLSPSQDPDHRIFEPIAHTAQGMGLSLS